MIWKFVGSGISEHYLIGTMHVGCAAAYTYATSAKRLIKRSDIFLAEMDLDEASRTDMSDASYLPDDKTLHDYLIDRHYHRLHRIIGKAFGLDLDIMQAFRPFLIINQLSSRVLQEGQLTPLDQYLWQYAKACSIETSGVESVAAQRELMEDMDIGLQVQMLRKAMRNVRHFKKVTKAMAQLYASGRYQQLYRSTVQKMGHLRQRMVHDRNDHMMQSIEQVISDHPSKTLCIAVGAGHIGGNTGLRAQLLRAGYSVQPVKN